MESYRVIDNFLPDLAAVEAVRQSALRAGFGNWNPGNGVLGVTAFAGVGFQGDHATMHRALSDALGCRIFPGSSLFRITDKEAAQAYIHSDRSDGALTAIVYLSHETDERSGTGFYRYRPNAFFPEGLKEMPCYKTMAGTHAGDRLKSDMTESSPEKWMQSGFVQGQINTALIFRAPLFHSRLPREGLGDTPENARMIWVCHFNV